MKNIDDMKDLKQVELEETKSTFGITEDPPLALKRTPSKHMPSIKRTPSSKNTDPSDSKPMLHPSSLEPVESEDKNSSLHVKAPSSYPTNLEDIFADIDDAGEGLVDSSLKFKVDGVFIHEDYPSSSSQRWSNSRPITNTSSSHSWRVRGMKVWPNYPLQWIAVHH
jgi:hypothetical protein